MTSFQSLIIILICILSIIIILYLIESDNFLPEKQIRKYVSLGKFKHALYLLDKYSENGISSNVIGMDMDSEEIKEAINKSKDCIFLSISVEDYSE